MTKRKNNINAYKVETDRAIYLVSLEHLANTPSGCPRFQANISTLIYKEDNETLENKSYFYTAVYIFKGHYFGEEKEARHIVEEHEEIIYKTLEEKRR